MALFRKLFYRKPPDGLLEICERVYVFDCCFTTDALEERDYRGYVGSIVSQLTEHYPDASILAFNFREGETQSQIGSALSEYDMTIMEYPRNYEGCPLLPMEVIHHFLRSSESWLSLGMQNLLLMHCERGGWPVLAFMLAALLIYRKHYSGELKTLDMVYKQAPRELLHLLSPLNPIPSQLRYLQYVSRRNVASQWPPLDRALSLDCIIIRMIPNFDGNGGCRPIFRIYGQDPRAVSDRSPKVLFSTPKKSKAVRHYKQGECEIVKFDINCHIQGDVVLECIGLHDDMEREVMMFRVMFNTAFIRSNILMLNMDEIDILWDAKDLFPKDFRAEVLFSEMDSVASMVPVDSSCFEDKDGLPVEAFAKVQEMFNSVDWLSPKKDAAVEVLQQLAVSNTVLEAHSHVEKSQVNQTLAALEVKALAQRSTDLTLEKQSNSSPKLSPNADLSRNQVEPHFSPTKIEAIISSKQTLIPSENYPQQSSASPHYQLSEEKTLHLSSNQRSDPNEIGMGPQSEAETFYAKKLLSAPSSQPAKDAGMLPGQSLLSPAPPPITPPLEDKIGLQNQHSSIGRLNLEIPIASTPPLKDDTLKTPCTSCSSAETPAILDKIIKDEPPISELPLSAAASAAAFVKSPRVTKPPPIHSTPIPDVKSTGLESIPPSTSTSSSLEVVQVIEGGSAADSLVSCPPPSPPPLPPIPPHESSSIRGEPSLSPPSPPLPPPLPSTPLDFHYLAESTTPPLIPPLRDIPVTELAACPPPPQRPPNESSGGENDASTLAPPLRDSLLIGPEPPPPPPPPPCPKEIAGVGGPLFPPPPEHSTQGSPNLTTLTPLSPPPLPATPTTESSSVPSPRPPPASPTIKSSSVPSPLTPSPAMPATRSSSILAASPPPASPGTRSSSVPSPPPPPASPSTRSSSIPSAPPPPPISPSISSSIPSAPPPPPISPSIRSSSVPSAPPPPPASPTIRSSSVPSAPPPPPASPTIRSSVPSAPPPPPASPTTVSPSVPSAPPPPPSSPTTRTSSVPSVPPPPFPSANGGSLPGFPSPPPPSTPPIGTRGRSLLSRSATSKNNQTKKLKPLHWLKISRAVSGSLWAEAQKSGEASRAPAIDISELESLFSAAAPNSDQGGSGRTGSKASMGSKPEKVQLIDHRRAYNCEIMLSKVKVPLPDMLSSVLALEDSGLDVDQVENLIKFCPTKEEMELLKGYKGDKDNLGKCEQFFLELMQVPRIEFKLRVYSFKIQFRSQVSDLRNNLNIVNSAADQIRGSSNLKKIMQTILNLGNALNQGTARGSAVGFKLDSLLKLTDTRARNNKMTLMHYLCKVLSDQLPELLDFWKDLSSLELASKIQLKYLAEEMQAINKGLEKVIQELSLSENDGPVSEQFCKALKEFLCYSEGEVRSLASLYAGVGRNVDSLILYFGEDPARCPFEQVNSTLLNFVKMFKQAHEDNCKQLESEKKKADKEATEKMKKNAPDTGHPLKSEVKSIK